MPQFAPSSVHQATITFSNPKSAGFDYTASLCMGAAMTVMATASFHLNAGESKPVAFSVTMSATSGTYPVYIAVLSGGKTIALYKATEDVVIVPLSADPNIAYLSSVGWTSSALNILVNSEQTALISYNLITVITKETEFTYIPYTFEVDLVLAGVVKASGVSISVSWNIGSPLSVAMTMPSTLGVYDVIIKAYRGSVLTGTYSRGQLTVYAIPEQSNLSYENFSFVRTRFYSSFESFDVKCDIRNIGNTTITRVVSLWAVTPDYNGYLSKSSWYEVLQLYQGQLYSGNAPTISLTLAPGQVFHYAFVGGMLVLSQYYVQLRDNMGGLSAIVTG